MWKAVAAPSDGKMGYLQHYLARARAVLRKTYEADELVMLGASPASTARSYIKQSSMFR
jgi:hypothetical protein